MRIVVGGLLAAFILASLVGQTAPDIERGATQDVVRRSYGWPKGRSVTDGRESWVYDHFQVTFRDGRVESITPLPTTKNSRAKAAVPKVVAPGISPPQRSVKSGTSESAHTAAEKAVRRGVQASPSHSASSTNSAASRPASSPQPKREVTVWTVLKPASAFLLPVLVILTVGAALGKRRRRTRRPTAPAPEPQSVAAKKTWQEDVAERLARMSAAMPQPVPSASTKDRRPGEAIEVSADAKPHELTLELLRALEWRRFERIVALYYAETGAHAASAGLGADGGVDVKLSRPGEDEPYCYVQCKAWGSEKVGVLEMRGFFGAMAADGVGEGVFVTTSDFWPDARAFAVANGIEALTGAEFVERFNGLPQDAREEILAEVMAGDYRTPTCPTCGVKTVSRMRRRDGVKFWACTRCKWTMTARTPS